MLQFLDYTLQEGTSAEAGIEQIRIEPGSSFCNRTIREVEINKGKEVVVLALRRSSGKMLYNPADGETLAGGSSFFVHPRERRSIKVALIERDAAFLDHARHDAGLSGAGADGTDAAATAFGDAVNLSAHFSRARACSGGRVRMARASS